MSSVQFPLLYAIISLVIVNVVDRSTEPFHRQHEPFYYHYDLLFLDIIKYPIIKIEYVAFNVGLGVPNND